MPAAKVPEVDVVDVSDGAAVVVLMAQIAQAEDELATASPKDQNVINTKLVKNFFEVVSKNLNIGPSSILWFFGAMDCKSPTDSLNVHSIR